MNKLQSFEIIKLESSKLNKSNSITGSLQDFRYAKSTVKIADNQMLRTLCQLKGENLSSNSFVEEIISVKFDNVQKYNKLVRDGIFVNGKKYVRFISSAGSLRRSTVFFALETIADKLIKIFDNNRNMNTKLIPSKLNAYRGLMTSGTLEISYPQKMVVVPDMEVTRDTLMSFVSNNGETIEDKVVPFGYSNFDGQGLVREDQAELWAKELGIEGYIPSWFVIRCSWMKGQLVTFPIREYADKYNQTKIIDVWGNEHDLRDVTTIISASQFKLWSSYKNMDEYLDACKKNNIGFGVTRCAKQYEREYSRLNYQFIQALDLDDEAVRELCEPTVAYFNSIINNIDGAALNFLLGDSDPDTIADFIEDGGDDEVIKALIENPEAIKDKSVRNKVIHSLNGKIRESYLGALLVRGAFYSICADPFAQMQWITTRDASKVTGLLNSKDHYCRVWSDRGAKIVASLRSPLTVGSEVNVIELKDTEELNQWFRYYNNGLIYNIFSDAAPRQSGFDFDGDIVMVTDNKVIIDHCRKGNAIGKESVTGTKIVVTKDEEILSESHSLGQLVGSITNVSSSLWSLLYKFDKGTKEYEEIYRRIQLCRFYQESEIDFAKTGIRYKMPEHWTKLGKITDDMTEEEKELIKFNNSICVIQRPAFMQNLYPEYMKKHNDERRKYDTHSILKFGKTLNELFESENLTDEEEQVLKNYYNNSFFINTPSPMNKVFWHMKKSVMEIKSSK